MQKVAVVGSGTMGQVHARAYSQMPNAALVAICDSVVESAQKLADSYSVKVYSDIDELLAKEDVDVIDICTPTSTHLDIIKKVAAAGKHICVEKPLTRNTQQAGEALKACEDAGVRLFVAHVLRWFPEFKRIHDLVLNGTIGNPTVVRTSRCGKHISGWYTNFEQSGGVVMDLMIHDLDWLRWTFGKVERVYARGLYKAGIQGTDYALATLRFESGVIAHVEGGWTRPSSFRASVEVAGTEGLLNYSNSDSAPITMEIKGKDNERAGIIVPDSPTGADPYYLELEHFITCLEEGTVPSITAQDGYEAVRLCEAVLESINTGKPVVLA